MIRLSILLMLLFCIPPLQGQSYIYDDINRVVLIDFGEATIQYCYDPLGNRTCRIITGGDQVTIDLTPTDGMIVNQASVGGTLTGSFVANNLGANASGSFTTYYVLSLNGTYEPNQDILLRSVQTPNLAGGAMETVDFSVSIPESVVPGAYQLLIIQDPGSLVEELSETNNILTWPVTIQDCVGAIMLSSSVDPANCGGTSGATVTASGGQPPYGYEWNTSPVQTGNNLVDQLAGVYTVTVTDALGCILVENVELLEEETQPSANFGYSRDGQTVTFTETSVGAATYSWDFGDGSNSSSANPVHTYATAGSYEVCLTVWNGCGSDVVCQMLSLNTDCPIPTNLVVNTVSASTASLGWENDGNVVRLEYRLLGSSSWISAGNQGGSVAILSGLASGETYEWRVMTVCTGDDSDWSAIGFFSTNATSGGSNNNPGFVQTVHTLNTEVEPTGVGEMANGDFLICGRTASNVSGIVVMRLNVAGEIVWAYRYDALGGNPDLALTTSHAYVLGSNGNLPMLMKLDFDGNVVWSEKYSGSNLSRPQDVVALNDGNLTIVADGLQGSDRAAFVFKVSSSDGAVMSGNRFYESGSDLDPSAIAIDDDGGNIGICGQFDGNGTSDEIGGEDVFFVRINPTNLSMINHGWFGSGSDDFAADISFRGEIPHIAGVTRQRGNDEPFILRGRSTSGLEGETHIFSNNVFAQVRGMVYTGTSHDAVIVGETSNSLDNNPTGMVLESSGSGSINVSRKVDIFSRGEEIGAVAEASNSGVVVAGYVQYQSSQGVYFSKYGTFGYQGEDFECVENPYNVSTTEYNWPSETGLSVSTITVTGSNLSSSRIGLTWTNEGLCCNATAGIQANELNICTNEELSLFSTSSGYDSLAWNNLTTGTFLGSTPSIAAAFTESGTYTIELSAFDGTCSDRNTVTVTVSGPASFLVNTADASCGLDNGSATITSPDPGANYQWSTGATGTEITNLSAGVYSVEVTDINGCTAVENFTIENVGSEFTAETTVYDVTCAGANDGNIEIVPIGAEEPVTYAWSGGNTGFGGLTDVGPGNYAFTVTDNNGCTFASSVTVDEPAPMWVDSTVVENTACQAPHNGQITVNPQGGTPPYSFQWSGRTETTNSLIGLESYDGSVTIMDANGCTYVSFYYLGPLFSPCNTYYADLDGDGFGDPNNTVQAITAPPGYLSYADDCDDTNPDINPMEPELCDGIDGNCNGMADEPYVDACGECLPREQATPIIVGGDTSICFGEWADLEVYDGYHYSADFELGIEDGIVIPNSPSLQVTGDLTLEMWIKPENFDRRQNPLVKAYGGEYTVTVETNRAVTFFNGSSGLNAQPYQGCRSPGGILKTNQWNHIAVVRNMANETITFYVNGAQRNTCQMTVLPVESSNRDVVIGQGYAGGFNGNIDEVRIWNQALTKATVQSWRTKRLNATHPNYTGLVLYQDFAYGTGNIAYDKSPSGNNGISASPLKWIQEEPPLSNPNYVWSNGDAGNRVQVSPREATTYSVMNTLALDGCSSEVTVSVASLGITNLPTVASCIEDTPANAEVVLSSSSASLSYDYGTTTGTINPQQNPSLSLTSLQHGLTPLTLEDEDGCVTYGSFYAEASNLTIETTAADPLCSDGDLQASIPTGVLDGSLLTNYQIGSQPIYDKRLKFTAGFNETVPTEAGKRYLVVAGGKYTVWSGCDFLDSGERYFDPAYYFWNDTVPSGSFITGAFDGVRPMVDTISPQHTYGWFIEGDGNPLRFTYSDSGYLDNCGHFDVQIWELTPLDIQWSTGENTSSVELSPVGVLDELSVIARENGLVVCEESILLEVEEQPGYTLSKMNATCGETNGNASVTNFGTATATWSTGASGPTISGLAAGDYTVTITSVAGCQVEEAFTIEDENLTAAVIMPAPLSVSCEVINGIFPYGISDAIDNTPARLVGVIDSLSGASPAVLDTCAGAQVEETFFANVDACSVGSLIRRVEVTQIDGTMTSGFQVVNILASGGACTNCPFGEILLSTVSAMPGEEVDFTVRLREGYTGVLKLGGQIIDELPESTTGLTVTADRPTVKYLSLEIDGVEVDRKAVRFESCDWQPSFFDDFSHSVVEVEPCLAIKDGYAYVAPFLATNEGQEIYQAYWSKVTDFGVPLSELDMSFLVRNHPAEGGLYQLGIEVKVYGSKGSTRFRASQAPNGNEVRLGTDNFNSFGAGYYNGGWTSFNLDFSATGVNWQQGINTDNYTYDIASLGDLLGIEVTFRGTGSINEISYTTEAGETYREDFDLCECLEEGIEDYALTIHERELRIALPTSLAPAPRAQNDLVVLGEFSGRYTGDLQREGRYLVFLSEQPFSAGEELNVTLAGGLPLSDGTTTEAYTWKETVPARHVTQGEFFFAPIGIQLPAEALDYSYSFSSADVDGNGMMDIVFHYFTAYGAASNQLIYLRNEDGSFQQPDAYTNSRSHSSIQGMPDLNGDGYPDLLVRHNVPSSAMIRLNNGDGTFGAATYYTVGDFSNGFAYGDMDADGDLDIISASGLSFIAGNTFTQLINDGAGNFTTTTTTTTGVFNATRHLNDLDGDGDLDLIYTSSTSFGSTPRFRIYENDGTGLLTQVVDQVNPGLQYVRQIADINGDKYLDLLLSAPSDIVIYGDGTLNYDYSDQDTLTHERYATTVIDVDADRDHDLLHTRRYDGANWTGPLARSERLLDGTYTPWLGVDTVMREALRPVDFDADGDIDHLALLANRRIMLVENVDSAFYFDATLMLAGAFNPSTSLMTDALRSAGYLPEVEPYGVDCRRVSTDVLAITGPTAIVDWIVIQLRSDANHNEVLREQTALLRRDGRVVDVDGKSLITFDLIPPAGYYISIRHRNHLGVMTALPSEISLRDTVALNFTDAEVTPTYGEGAQGEVAGQYLLRAGDANQDGIVRYSDLFVPPFTFIPSDALSVFTKLNGRDQITGYHPQDINMDGKVRYSDLFVPPFTIIPSDALRIFNALEGDPAGQEEERH